MKRNQIRKPRSRYVFGVSWFVLLLALVFSGYFMWERQRNTWTVDSEFGFEFLKTEHGEVEGGEHFMADTYGTLIRNGDRSLYLLWENGSSPFGLKNGDRVRLEDSLYECYYDRELNGYHAGPEDVIHLN